ncbi:MAG: cation transporter, partial [Actinomycetota bacterium]
MEKLTVPIKGMHCASCALVIEKTLSKTEGIKEARVNYGTEKVTVEYDKDKVSLEKMSYLIKPFGYEFIGIEPPMETTCQLPDAIGSGVKKKDPVKEQKLLELEDQKSKVQFVLPIAIMVFVLMMWEIAAKSISGVPRFFLPHELYSILLLVISSIVLFWIGKPFLAGIGKFIRYRTANMDTLVGIGTITAFLYSSFIVLFPQLRIALRFPESNYFDVTIIVIGFVSFGKYLEARSKLKTGEAIEKLINLQAKTALVERDGMEIEIPIEHVQINDILIVKP